MPCPGGLLTGVRRRILRSSPITISQKSAGYAARLRKWHHALRCKGVKESAMVFTLPADVDQRPVVIDGAGTLGRQIASVYAAGGSDVRIFDLSAEQRQAARDYVEEHLAQTQQTLGLLPARRGRAEVSDDLQDAVAGCWMVIEAVPESIDIKEHYAAVREGIPEGPRKLLRDYTDQGRLGVKTERGFYDYRG